MNSLPTGHFNSLAGRKRRPHIPFHVIHHSISNGQCFLRLSETWYRLNRSQGLRVGSNNFPGYFLPYELPSYAGPPFSSTGPLFSRPTSVAPTPMDTQQTPTAQTSFFNKS
ncbi:unnamed protein product [Ectocarpus sp. 12 AP-2014]